jgi:hypothetical protein
MLKKEESNMRFLIIVLLLLLVACSSTNPPPADDEFSPVTVQELIENKEEYDGRQVVFDAYIVGSEYNPSEDGAQFFILSLGQSSSPKRGKNTIYCPGVKYKIRAAEDGYNKEIIEDCFRMSNLARRMGQKVTVFGTYKPNEEFYYYTSGIDLRIAKMRIGNKTINTDFADKSKVAHDTPGLLKKVYQGGKKIYELAKKLSVGI